MNTILIRYQKACNDYNEGNFSSCAKNLVEIYNESNSLDIDLCCYCMYKLAEINIDDENIDIILKILEEQADLKEQHLKLIESVKTQKKQIDVQIDLNIKKLKKSVVINSYYDESSSGVGDFLRGCCYLHTLFSDRGLDNFEIDFKHHQIGHFIKSQCGYKYKRKNIFDTEKYFKEHSNTLNYFDNMKNNLNVSLSVSTKKSWGFFKKKIHIFSNYSDFIFKNPEDKLKHVISDNTKKFMKSNIIFDKTVDDKFQELATKEYDVIHFRLGDYQILKDNKIKIQDDHDNNINTTKFDISYDRCLDLVVKSIIDAEKHVVLLSDSNSLKDYVVKNIPERYASKLIVLHYNSFHCSSNPGFLDNIITDKKDKKNKMFYVALDMKICTQAQKIVSYSVYPWGSGFTFWLSRIYDIPIFSKVIESNELQ